MTSTVPGIAGARELFPGTAECTYLEAAGISLVSTAASDAVNSFLAEASIDPGAAHHGTRLDDARAAAARLVGARPEQIALLTSTSVGMNVIADSIALVSGDNVVSSDAEFISIIAPFQKRCHDVGASLRVVESEHGRLDPDRILTALDKRTRAVVLSSVVWTSGYRVNIGEIGRECRRLRRHPRRRRHPAGRRDSTRRRGGLYRRPRLRRTQGGLDRPRGWDSFTRAMLSARAMLPPFHTHLPPSHRVKTWASLWRDPAFSPLREFPHPWGARRFEIGCHHAAMSACGLAAAIGLLESAGGQKIADHVIGLGNLVAEALSELGLSQAGYRARQRPPLGDHHRPCRSRARGRCRALELPPRAPNRHDRSVHKRRRRAPHLMPTPSHNNLDDVDALIDAIRTRPASR